MSPHRQTWHVLQISNVLDEELASALSESVDVIAWRPVPRLLGNYLYRSAHHRPAERRSASLRIRTFPHLRGYARAPFSLVARTGSYLSRLLLRHGSAEDVLVCTTPFLAPVAERWPGPVVYWLTDRIASYEGARGIDVPALDRRMCSAATLVCPNSQRLRDYLIEQANCPPDRIHVLPNATRAANLLPAPLLQPGTLPAAVAHRTSPVAGVIGNMGSNLDWPLLLRVVRQTPWLTWLFVGPVGNDIADPALRAARQEVQYCRNACFTGGKPYGELVHYARSFHVAVLPYRRCEPTFSGSSTRFYEHLAACRPMIATLGFAELLSKQPLVRLTSDADVMLAALQELRDRGFRDGLEEERWRDSYANTWQVRAKTMQAALQAQLQAAHPLPAFAPALV